MVHCNAQIFQPSWRSRERENWRRSTGPTGIATIVLFSVIDRAGPTFLSTINYLIPAVAFFCGAWLLDEPVSWMHFAALAAILGGIGITRIRAQPVLH